MVTRGALRSQAAAAVGCTLVRDHDIGQRTTAVVTHGAVIGVSVLFRGRTEGNARAVLGDLHLALGEAAEQEVFQYSIRGLRGARFKQEAAEAGTVLPGREQGSKVQAALIEPAARDCARGPKLRQVVPGNRNGPAVDERAGGAARV